MTGNLGRSGGPRINSGGSRPGAGRSCNFDILIMFALFTLGIVILINPWKLFEGDTKGALAGALWGGATLLLGNWINRYNDRRLVEEEITGRRDKSKVLITSELDHVARNLFYAREKIDGIFSAINKVQVIDSQGLDMSRYYPQTLYFFDHLGIDIIILDKNTVDSLVALRSNLEMSKISTERLSRTTHIDASNAIKFSLILKSNMDCLCKAFKNIEPNHKFKLGDQPEQLIIEMLQAKIDRSPRDNIQS